MEMQTDLTSIILELTQLSPLFTLKEESIYISSLLYLFQTPEQFTHSNVPLKVLRLLEHKYSLCIPDRDNSSTTTLLENSSLRSLDPVFHPGMLFLQFSPNPSTTEWIQNSFSSYDNVITTANLSCFRFTLEIVFTYLHTSKCITGAFVHQSVIREFLSSSKLDEEEQNSQFFTSLAGILQLLTSEALILLLNSNRNGNVLLDYIIHSLTLKHANTYSSLILCLLTIFAKLGLHIWKYTDELSLITNLIISPCLLACLEEWSLTETSPLCDVIFSWCEPYFSSITRSQTPIKHTKILFKWLTYLSNQASSNPNHKYTDLTFVDILIETFPTPNFQSSSSLASASAVLFSKILLKAFSDNLLELVLNTKEDWLPLFKAISTAFSTQQSTTVHSQLNFRYFQRHKRFNISTSLPGLSPEINVFRLWHELIVKIFNSGLEYSLPCAASIVDICRQKQPINKVGMKVISILQALKEYHEQENIRTSILIDLRDDEDAIDDAQPDVTGMYYQYKSSDISKTNRLHVSSTGSSSSDNRDGEKECMDDNATRVDHVYPREVTNLNVENVSVTSPDTTVPDCNDSIHSPARIAPANSSVSVHNTSQPNKETAVIQTDYQTTETVEAFPVEISTAHVKHSMNQLDRHMKDDENGFLRKRKHLTSDSCKPEKLSLKIRIDLKLLQRKPERISNLKKYVIQSHFTGTNNKPKISHTTKTSTPVLKLLRNVDKEISNTETQLFNLSFIKQSSPTEPQFVDKSTARVLDIPNTNTNNINNNNVGGGKNEANQSFLSPLTIERVRDDLFISHLSLDEEEESRIPIPKRVRQKSNQKPNPIPNPVVKRKKTNVTTMRPPFSRSRLTTLTDSPTELSVEYSKPDTLYKNTDLKVLDKSHPTSPNSHQYLHNISLDLPELESISPGEITRLNDKAKRTIQPCTRIKTTSHSPNIHSPILATTAKKRTYIQHSNPIVSKPTSKINPDEHIDNILSWSPGIFLRDGSEPRGMPPISSPSPLPLSYRSYDEYKQLLTNCLLHEISCNLDEEIERIESVPYTEFIADKPCTHKEDNRPVIVEFTNSTPENDSPINEFIKEQDLVLMKIKSRPPDPINNDIMLFGYITKTRAEKTDQIETDSNLFSRGKRTVSKVTLSIKYDTRHVISKFSKLSIKPLISLTTYNRQWRGLISLYKNTICQHILSPSQRVCDPPHNSSVVKIRIPNEDLFNESQKHAITRVTSMVSEPLACPRIALLLGPPGCGKSHTITGFIQTILKTISTDRLKHHILLCTPSNASADELALKLSHMDLINTHDKIGKSMQSIQRNYGINVIHKSSHEEVNRGDEGKLTLIRLGQLDLLHSKVKPYHIDNLTSSVKLQCTTKLTDDLREHEILKSKLDIELENLENQLECLKLHIENMGNSLAVRADREDTVSALAKAKTKLQNALREISRLQNQIYKSKVTDMQVKENLLSNANLILTTLSSSGISMMEEMFKENHNTPMHFSCVIVDEATQCSELDILIPLQFMITKLVLVGDPNQLPAVIKSPLLQGNGYGRSLFERFHLFFNEDCDYDNPIMRLDTQYRMHPEICHFPNKTFYQGQLHTCHDIKLKSENILNPYLLFHIFYGQEISNKPGQIVNMKEIEFVVALVRELRTKFDPASIGIITPYQAQLRELAKYISKFSENIEIKSVDGFQGKEKDIIIISCVRSKSKTGTIGFLSNPKRINVALTRAKNALYIVGDVDSLKRNPTWNKLIQDAGARDKLLSISPMNIEASIGKIWLKKQY
ncbi:helicase senataxin-like [Oopsacas minuta]|uniref:Helicase senataxin-like n=1 Tax=Oopsacas minuta TaxID=111878 RepID=A0AAV7JZW1_9METZ|nr:helicase senataxin-like [Oopsacas minuta]